MKRLRLNFYPVVVAALLAVMLSGCANQADRQSTLYAQLGGQPGIDGIVNSFLIRIANDPVLVETFAAANIGRLRELLAEQFCELSDGPCKYTGFSMKESHRGMAITEAEFNAIVEDLILAMEDENVRIPVQNQLLARLAPLFGEIVYQ